MTWDAIAAAGGAALVAALNELRAHLRARQADRDRQAAELRAAELAAILGRAGLADLTIGRPEPEDHEQRR